MTPQSPSNAVDLFVWYKVIYGGATAENKKWGNTQKATSFLLSLLISFWPLSPHCVCLSGLMTPEELRHLEDLPSPHNKFWVPCMWFVSLALRARSEGRINNDVALTAILTVGVRVRLRPKEPELLRLCENIDSENVSLNHFCMSCFFHCAGIE